MRGSVSGHSDINSPPPPLPLLWETWKIENLPTETPQGRAKIEACALGLGRWHSPGLQVRRVSGQKPSAGFWIDRARVRAPPSAPYPAARGAWRNATSASQPLYKGGLGDAPPRRRVACDWLELRNLGNPNVRSLRIHSCRPPQKSGARSEANWR